MPCTRGAWEPDRAQYIEQEISSLWSDNAKPFGLECRHFNGGVELRCIGIDKGRAIRGLMEEMPGETLCIYIGDDATDEDAFSAIQEQGYGIGIKVGSAGSATAAVASLPDVEAVKRFLQEWADATIQK